MPKKQTRMRFDLETLRDLAGDPAFERGQAYHHNGRVKILAIEPGRASAVVSGTQEYRTAVTTVPGEGIGGECSCPAFERVGFCKHMVATAMAANAAFGKEEAVGALPRIREHLQTKGVEALVGIIVEVAGRDPALLRKLEMAAAAAAADDGTIAKQLRKAIDQATRTRGYVDYGEVPGWAAGVEEVLDAVAELPSAGRGALALELATRALQRIEDALASVDDSDGHGGSLLNRCQEIHLAAAVAARPEPVQFARELFELEVEGEFDIFDGATELYAEVLGEEGLAEYQRLAAEAWEKLPARSARDGKRGFAPASYRRLRDILDIFAKRVGDVEVRIALRAKDLSSQWNYLQLAEFCLSQGRPDEALRYAEEGLWTCEDDGPDERLVTFASKLLLKSGRSGEAEALLRRAFEKAPSLELYAPLRRFGDATRNWAIEFLRKRLRGKVENPWLSPADLLVSILVLEKAYEQAWAIVRDFGASDGAKQRLARESEGTHPQQAMEVYSQRVDRLVSAGGNQAYADACALIQRMAKLRSAVDQMVYVSTLKERFRRKRNFMKLLE